MLPLLLASSSGLPESRSQTIEFVDVAEKAGVSVRFFTGTRGKHDLPEIMGGGVGLIDINQDGLLDLFFPNGGPIVATPGAEDPPCRLFLNLGKWRFREITATAGVPGPSYAMGCAVGDFDRDGRDDLFVTGWRDQRLYRNLGNGRFEDVTRRAGLLSTFWSTSAAFADLDADGDLDLYVCNYVAYDPVKAPYCSAPDGRRDFCGPEEFDAQPDRLYQNNGDGTFTDVSESAGIADRTGRALGVVVSNMSGDRRPDLFVANDGTSCRLYENRGGMTFQDVGTESGVALDGQGRHMAAMGLAVGDWSGDGRLDLVVSNFLGRSTIAFAGQQSGLYTDESRRSGLSAQTTSVLGFGVALEDFDGDGDLDLIQANGHVLDRGRMGEPLAMKPVLLRNENGRFADASRPAGSFFKRSMIGRGLAVGDLDLDGRPDVVIVPLDGPVAILQNQTQGGSFVRVPLVSASSVEGAVVHVSLENDSRVIAIVGGGGYLSSSERSLRLGLGHRKIRNVRIDWPSGRTEMFDWPAGPSVPDLTEGRGVSTGDAGADLPKREP